MICVRAKPFAQWQLTWHWTHLLIAGMLFMGLVTVLELSALSYKGIVYIPNLEVVQVPLQVKHPE